MVTVWREVRFAVVDVETTGTDQRVHEVLSIGIVPVEEGRISVGNCYYQTVRPTVAPGRSNVIVHGIRPVDSAGAQLPADVALEVEDRLRGRVLVAHVADIERNFLNRWLTQRYIGRKDVIDTDPLSRLVIARRGGPLLMTHIGLGAAAAQLGVPEHRRHHALGDALTTAQLFLASASLVRPDGLATLNELRRVTLALERERIRRRVAMRISRHGRGQVL